MKKTTDWHTKAKQLRREGVKLKLIAEEVDKSLNRVYQVVQHIECPVEHRGRPEERPEWYFEIPGLREQGMTLQQIGDKFGVTKERIRQILLLLPS